MNRRAHLNVPAAMVYILPEIWLYGILMFAKSKFVT